MVESSFDRKYPLVGSIATKYLVFVTISLDKSMSDASNLDCTEFGKNVAH